MEGVAFVGETCSDSFLTREGPTACTGTGDGMIAGAGEAPDPGTNEPAVGLKMNSLAATLNLVVEAGTVECFSSAGTVTDAALLAALAAAAFAASKGGMEGSAQADAFFCPTEIDGPVRAMA